MPIPPRAAISFFRSGLRSVLNCNNLSAHIMEPLFGGKVSRSWTQWVVAFVDSWRSLDEGLIAMQFQHKTVLELPFPYMEVFTLQNPSRQLTQQLRFDSALEEPGLIFCFPRFFLAGGLSCFSEQFPGIVMLPDVQRMQGQVKTTAPSGRRWTRLTIFCTLFCCTYKIATRYLK